MKSIASIAALAVSLFMGAPALAQQHAAHEAHQPNASGQSSVESTVPLYDGLGTHTYTVTTKVPAAQSYFNQGMRLYYAFNHQESIRSFREAQRLDPDCAACFWGEALAWGPNINMPMDASGNAAALAALTIATAKAGSASAKEQALVQALATRYDANPSADRSSLDRAYANAMLRLAQQYPNDSEIAVLSSEAVMTQMPWDYWDENAEPRAGIADALNRLESVMEADTNHPGACHFFIHAIEKHYPERAVPCAEKLAGLMPAAGHIVHMPGHIYIRVGRYKDAIKANEHAVHADESYIQDQNPAMGMYTAGYYPHNYDFLAFAASMIGRSEQGIGAAQRVQDVTPPEMLSIPGYTFAQHYAMRPMQLLVRFGKWDEILKRPSPDLSLPHARAIWLYATGRALAATGDLVGARRTLAELHKVRLSPEMESLRLEFNSVDDIIGIAESVLSGWIFAGEGDFDAAVAQLRQGVAMEDKLLYGEPPEWTIPVRHDLGAVLLMAERLSDAEQVFRADLDHFAANGWSLYGLSAALKGQGRAAEASAVDAEFATVWADADVTLESSVIR